MTFTAAQIAAIIKGTVEGEATTAVHSFGKIEEAQAGQLAFLANPKYEDYLYTTQASIVIIDSKLQLKKPVSPCLVRVADPYSSFALLLNQYQQMIAQQLKGIQEPSYISKTAIIGEDVFVGAFTFIGENVKLGKNVKLYPQVYIGNNVSIGDDSVLFPGVKIYHDCILGKNVTIHAGTVIGSDGFGFAPQADGSYQKVSQIGNVVIEDGVEIGANTTIDRATMGSTLIRAGVKLDNLIQIAHNVEIGNNTVVAAQTGISGSTKIGSQVMVGGQVGFAGHIKVADGTKIAAQSGITKTIKQSGLTLNGTPAFENASHLRIQAHLRSLPEMEKRLKELEQKLADFQKNNQ